MTADIEKGVLEKLHCNSTNLWISVNMHNF